ncbi:MAG: branched-chain amino acid ABC transporter substrate-binding protein [Alphaproteobacteria bacterium]|nr:branched-chain amino acid ABC transporter substrate-binding protein [Alphaproteobacteria bacterium]
MRYPILSAAAVLAVATLTAPAGAQDYIRVGSLVDFTGNTASVGKDYGQAKIDAANWINDNGGVNGKLLDLDTVDYTYIVPRAIAAYKKWVNQKVSVIQGWGTADTEALVGFLANDKIPYFSASYSAHLTDPQGKGPQGTKAAPYNFPMGPSYSDGVRALIQWAADDWKKKGGAGKAKFVHMGDNHPYPNAPKKAGEEYARELGFDVLPAVTYSLAPGDFKAQCLSLKDSGGNYAFLANTSGANISLLRSCETVGVQVQFMANIWGFDENVMKAAGKAADGVAWVMGAAKWGDNVPGMKLVQDVSKMSDPSGKAYRSVHYIRGICSMFWMKEAIEWADKNGGINGPNIKNGMYKKANWVPAGLEGVCPSGTWTESDHRGITKVLVYRSKVTGATDGDLAALVTAGTIGMEKVFEGDMPRRPEWLGW